MADSWWDSIIDPLGQMSYQPVADKKAAPKPAEPAYRSRDVVLPGIASEWRGGYNSDPGIFAGYYPRPVSPGLDEVLPTKPQPLMSDVTPRVPMDAEEGHERERYIQDTYNAYTKGELEYGYPDLDRGRMGFARRDWSEPNSYVNPRPPSDQKFLDEEELQLQRYEGGGGAAPPAPTNALMNVSQSQPQSNYLGDAWNFILGEQTYTGPRQRPDSDLQRILKNWAGPRQPPVDMSTSEGRANARVNDMLNPWTFLAGMSKDEWSEPHPRTVAPGITQYPHQFGPLYQPRGEAPPDRSRQSIDDFKAWLKANPDNPQPYLDISQQLEDQRKYNYAEEGKELYADRLARFPSWGGLFDPRPMVGAAGRMLDPRPLLGSIGSGIGKMHDTVFPPAY